MWEQKNEQDQPVINQNCGSGSILIRVKVIKNFTKSWWFHIFFAHWGILSIDPDSVKMLGLGHDQHGKFGKNAGPQFWYISLPSGSLLPSVALSSAMDFISTPFLWRYLYRYKKVIDMMSIGELILRFFSSTKRKVSNTIFGSLVYLRNILVQIWIRLRIRIRGTFTSVSKMSQNSRN